jgi:hypothetical protein
MPIRSSNCHVLRASCCSGPSKKVFSLVVVPKSYSSADAERLLPATGLAGSHGDCEQCRAKPTGVRTRNSLPVCRRKTTIRRKLVGWRRRCSPGRMAIFHHERSTAFLDHQLISNQQVPQHIQPRNVGESHVGAIHHLPDDPVPRPHPDRRHHRERYAAALPADIYRRRLTELGVSPPRRSRRCLTPVSPAGVAPIGAAPAGFMGCPAAERRGRTSDRRATRVRRRGGRRRCHGRAGRSPGQPDTSPS